MSDSYEQVLIEDQAQWRAWLDANQRRLDRPGRNRDARRTRRPRRRPGRGPRRPPALGCLSAVSAAGHPRMDHQRQDQHHPRGPHPAHRRRRRPQHPRQPVAATHRTPDTAPGNPRSTPRTRLTPNRNHRSHLYWRNYQTRTGCSGPTARTDGVPFSCSYSAGASRRKRGAGEVVATTADRLRNGHVSRGLAAASHAGCAVDPVAVHDAWHRGVTGPAVPVFRR